MTCHYPFQKNNVQCGELAMNLQLRRQECEVKGRLNRTLENLLIVEPCTLKSEGGVSVSLGIYEAPYNCKHTFMWYGGVNSLVWVLAWLARLFGKSRTITPQVIILVVKSDDFKKFYVYKGTSA